MLISMNSVALGLGIPDRVLRAGPLGGPAPGQPRDPGSRRTGRAARQDRCRLPRAPGEQVGCPRSAPLPVPARGLAEARDGSETLPLGTAAENEWETLNLRAALSP